MSMEKVFLEKSWHLLVVSEVRAFNLLSPFHTDPLKEEPVAFSGRIQLLVSKLGRSSKPSPRFIVVVSLSLPSALGLLTHVLQTKKVVHIVIATSKDGVPQMSLERKIPLATIKTIGMSTLRDDWMVSPFSLPSTFPAHPIP